MTTQIWLAPAKLNLFLHITGRRADGYHLLQTVFQLLDYGDELSFETTADGSISLATSMPGVDDDENLIVRAARLLQSHTQCSSGAKININKVLPMGGGLGGGSSDAATTLVALNCLWKTSLPVDALASLGLQLGADVPVFVRGQTAWAEGVGENLTPVKLPECWYVVVNPCVHVSTAELFSHPELTRDCAAITIRGFHTGVGLGNVFQSLVCKLYPQVADAIAILSQAAIDCKVKDERKTESGADDQYRGAMMTGTGACVFLPCETEHQAQNVLGALRSELPAFIARGVNRSSLFVSQQTSVE